MTHEYTIDGVPKTKDEFFRDVRVIMHEAGHAFYHWENSTYGVDSTLSDEDRILWMQGYVYAYKQLKGLL